MRMRGIKRICAEAAGCLALTAPWSIPAAQAGLPDSLPPVPWLVSASDTGSQLPWEKAPAAKAPPPPGPGVSSDHSRILKLVPPESALQDRIEILDVQPSLLLPVGKEMLPPVQLEASFTEAISLKDALALALKNNLPIQITKADWEGERFKYLGSYGRFIPSMSMNYTPQRLTSGVTSVSVSPYFITMVYPVFLGGGAIFNTLKARHDMQASRHYYRASVNDVLLDVYERYYDLVLNTALMAIRAKAVEVSSAQLSINQDLKTAGLGTEFEVMQSRTLLALDRQKLVHQEVAARRSALNLTVALNGSVVNTLVPADRVIDRQDLIDPAMKPELLTALAIENRPELARWEELRLAARNAARLAFSPLLPRAGFFTNNAINISGGASDIIIPTGGSSAAGGITSQPSGGANSAFSMGFILNWLLVGAGVEDAGNVLAARMKAKRAMLAGREELVKVCSQVRLAYLDIRAAETDIEVTSEAVSTAAEEVRMADLRLRHQLGTNLELIQAEKDYIDSLSRRIEAFVSYKKAQARLLHAIGLISVDTLVSGRPQTFNVRKQKR